MERWLAVGSLVLLILLAARPLIPPLRCPSDCIRYRRNGHCYCLTPEGLTWPEAEAFARLRGGHLVTINGAAEQAWLVKTFGGDRWMWIGLGCAPRAEPPGVLRVEVAIRDGSAEGGAG